MATIDQQVEDAHFHLLSAEPEYKGHIQRVYDTTVNGAPFDQHATERAILLIGRYLLDRKVEVTAEVITNHIVPTLNAVLKRHGPRPRN